MRSQARPIIWTIDHARVEADLDDPEDRSGPPHVVLFDAMHFFAAELVARSLPDDPVCHAAVIREAEAFGVNVADALDPSTKKT
jgi:hypothetical protein